MAKLYLLVAAVSLLQSYANAQGVVRRGSTFPQLARRQNCTADCTSTTSAAAKSCSADCKYCVQAWRIEWRELPRSLETITIVQEVQEDGRTETFTTSTWSDALIEKDYSSYLSLIASPVSAHEFSFGSVGGNTATFPTPYLTVQSDYDWVGTLPTIDQSNDETCETRSPESDLLTPADDVPSLVALPVVSTPMPSSSRFDPHGYYFELTATLTNIPAVYTNEAAIRSCSLSCADKDFEGVVAANTRPQGIPDFEVGAISPQLTLAFVTACVHGTTGTAPKDPCPPATQNPAPPNQGGGSGSGSGGNPANANPDNRMTTTNKSGQTVIVTAPPSGPQLRPSTNAQGGVVIVTVTDGGSGAGQVTLTNAAGETVLVQGGTLVDASGAHDGNAITVTNAANELVVVEGGVTGTLQAGEGGQVTVIVAGTVTQTSWRPGESIQGGDRGAQPTVQGGGCRGGGRADFGWLLGAGMVVMGAVAVVAVVI